ncbi:hypothetical protein [Leptolyngbya iicbica]|uniref:Uncharacterized protein n=1 Tax=Lyngbya confervoides BDU141951 TaxID=1574623 RepID=A0A8T6QT06_9CYAN|nr:hypothetical protein [Leptolyngbya sp. LK]
MHLRLIWLSLIAQLGEGDHRQCHRTADRDAALLNALTVIEDAPVFLTRQLA